MALLGQQFKRLQAALLSAFPTYAALAQMVRIGLDQSLDAIAGGSNQSERIYNLIEAWT